MVRRRCSQFSLKSLMAVMVVLGLAFARLEKYLAEQRPVAWQPFSQALLEEKRAAGSPVLVRFSDDFGGYSTNPVFVAALETAAVRRLLRSNKIVPMRADIMLLLGQYGFEIERELDSFRLSLGPAIAIYPADNNAKLVLVENKDLNEAKVIEAIHRVVRSGSSAPGGCPFYKRTPGLPRRGLQASGRVLDAGRICCLSIVS